MKPYKRFIALVCATFMCFLLASCQNPTAGETGPLSTDPYLPASGTPSVDITPPADTTPNGETTEPTTPMDGDPEPGETPSGTPVLPDYVPENPSEWTTNELKFSVLTYEKAYDQAGEELLRVTAQFPQTGTPSIDRFYEDCRDDFIRLSESKLENARSYYEDGSLDMSHYIYNDYAVELNSGGLLSVSRRTTLFEGGSSESTTIVCENFSLISGELLWMDDIFTVDREEYTERLLETVYEVIDNDPQRFYEDAKELAKTLFPYDSFCITKDGLSLFYAQYNIAPYTEHIVRIDVPWERFGEIFRIPG